MAADDRRALGQYPTPLWLADAIVERYFPQLDTGDLVLEPTCGPGRFLQAIPASVPAIGVELDPDLAEEARRNSGRPVMTGDIRTVQLDMRPTAIIGNPPFQVSLIESLMDRAWDWLPENGRMGLILPAYMFQTAARTARYAERWSISQDMVPRNVYPGLSKPLCFAVFTKDFQRTLVGFAFYREASAVLDLPKESQAMLGQAEGSLWTSVVVQALTRLGGEGSLQDIYKVIEGKRPTETAFWREKVRQVCQLRCIRRGRGHYALPDRCAA